MHVVSDVFIKKIIHWPEETTALYQDIGNCNHEQNGIPEKGCFLIRFRHKSLNSYYRCLVCVSVCLYVYLVPLMYQLLPVYIIVSHAGGCVCVCMCGGLGRWMCGGREGMCNGCVCMCDGCVCACVMGVVACVMGVCVHV